MTRFLEYVIIVEGKKDVSSLQSLGFFRVYALNVAGVPIRERIEQIAKDAGRKEEVCILTDFDKKGRKLYEYVKAICQELGFRLDSKLRGILIKSGISHIEGIDNFIEKAEENQ